MDNILEIIRNRRSVRKYKSEKVPEDELKKILDAGRWAPSSGNTQPTELVVIVDQSKKKQLVRAASGQSFLAGAPVVIVVCANIPRTRKRYGKRGSELFVIQDTAASIQNIHLAAKALGYATCWVGAFHEEKVKDIIETPDEIRPVAIITIGKPGEDPEAPNRRKIQDMTHKNTFGKSYYPE